MPIKAFWFVSGCVERLRTDEARSLLEITTTAQNPEAAVEAIQQMDQLAKPPVRYSAKAIVAASSIRDEGGFAELKGLSGQ